MSDTIEKSVEDQVLDVVEKIITEPQDITSREAYAEISKLIGSLQAKNQRLEKVIKWVIDTKGFHRDWTILSKDQLGYIQDVLNEVAD